MSEGFNESWRNSGDGQLLGPRDSRQVTMLVDTGATLTKIPESVAKELGMRAEEVVSVMLADGSLRSRGLGEARLEFGGRTRTVPILIGPDGEEQLLGLTTLEIFQLKVNPVTHQLEPAVPIEYAVSASMLCD